MGFWIFTFFCNLLIPVMMIVTGRMMWKHTPKTINSVYGYRTTMSSKNMDTWKFAHEHSGKLWWKLGWIMLFPSILVQLPFVNSNEDVVGSITLVIDMVQLVVMIGSIVPTELALRRTFDKNGVRK